MQKYHAYFYLKFYFQMSKLIMHLSKNVQHSLCQRRSALAFLSAATSAGLQKCLRCPLRHGPCLCCRRTFHRQPVIALHLRSNRKPHVFNQVCFIFMWLRRNTRSFLHKSAAPVSLEWHVDKCTWHLLHLQYEFLILWKNIFDQLQCHHSEKAKPCLWSALHKIGECLFSAAG